MNNRPFPLQSTYSISSTRYKEYRDMIKASYPGIPLVILYIKGEQNHSQVYVVILLSNYLAKKASN